jgi:hypothetical protein
MTAPAVSTLEVEIERLKAENLAITAKQTAQDAKLLEIIKKFQPQVPGALAVDVHEYFHACGLPEDRVRQIIESAVSRNIITRVTIDVYSAGSIEAKSD